MGEIRRSEWRVGIEFLEIELGRRGVDELIAPSLLHLRAVGSPQGLARSLKELRHRQRLLGRPMPRHDDRRARRAAHDFTFCAVVVADFVERCRLRAAMRSSASFLRYDSPSMRTTSQR